MKDRPRLHDFGLLFVLCAQRIACGYEEEIVLWRI